jgi:exodeoxyribonuclease VIII
MRLVRNLKADEYHADNEHLSSSDLKLLLRSPAHFLEKSLNPAPPTPAMEFGTMAHTFILEPHLFEQEYAVGPKLDGPRNHNPYKKLWDDFKQSEGDRKICAHEEYQQLEKMRDSILSNKYCKSIFGYCEKEVSAFVFRKKSRADLLDETGGFIWDLKTCEDARPENFARDVAKYKYHLSAAYYMDVFSEAGTKKQIKNFGWIAVEKKAPYNVTVMIATPEMIDVGRAEYRKALGIYEKCLASKSYPGYETKIHRLELPKFYRSEAE